MTHPEGGPLRLMISFCPQDSELKDRLVRHLQVLVRYAGIDLWTVDRVRAGDDWRQELDAALDGADVAVLLMSADFMASDFLQDVELPKLFQRREQGGLRVVPVLLRSCLWQAHPWLSTLKPLPNGIHAIASLREDSRDSALTEVARAIAQLKTTRSVVPPCETLPIKRDRCVILEPFESLRIGRSPTTTPLSRIRKLGFGKRSPQLLQLDSPSVSRNHLEMRYEQRSVRYEGGGGDTLHVVTIEDLGSSFGAVVQTAHGEHGLGSGERSHMEVAADANATIVLSPTGSAAVLRVCMGRGSGFGAVIVDIIQDGEPFKPEPFDTWMWRVLSRLRAAATRLPMSPSITITTATTIIPGSDFDIWPDDKQDEDLPHWRATFSSKWRTLEQFSAVQDEIQQELQELHVIVDEEKKERSASGTPGAS